jgi:hypothetical protein
MHAVIRSVGAFIVCFTFGAILSLLFGLDFRNWIPAGIVVSSVVAVTVFRK